MMRGKNPKNSVVCVYCGGSTFITKRGRYYTHQYYYLHRGTAHRQCPLSGRRCETMGAAAAAILQKALDKEKALYSVLDDWRICHVHEPGGYTGRVEIDVTHKIARVSDVPKGLNINHYAAHEVLHLMMQVYRRIPSGSRFELEEQIIQQLCIRFGHRVTR